ncbi:unnamed protein product, partial [Urochloa humidicola]
LNTRQDSELVQQTHAYKTVSAWKEIWDLCEKHMHTAYMQQLIPRNTVAHYTEDEES